MAEADSARALGFAGKSCVHPRQVAWANAAFSPSEEEIEAARRIVGAATMDGSAFAVDGRMVDAPFLARARAILAMLEREHR
ncbi:HpcH/HpaI aldolase/citrate lyase family protein [Pseudoxanthomonas mexicana]|nr:HpcH/HpaI aldolase/citrate lyase family protein [Pseudoxanthomonas mexicana]